MHLPISNSRNDLSKGWLKFQLTMCLTWTEQFPSRDGSFGQQQITDVKRHTSLRCIMETRSPAERHGQRWSDAARQSLTVTPLLAVGRCWQKKRKPEGCAGRQILDIAIVLLRGLELLVWLRCLTLRAFRRSARHVWVGFASGPVSYIAVVRGTNQAGGTRARRDIDMAVPVTRSIRANGIQGMYRIRKI